MEEKKNFLCPSCGKEIISANKEDGSQAGDRVLKSRLVFLNNDGNLLCKCGECRKVVALPMAFAFNKEEPGIKIIDL